MPLFDYDKNIVRREGSSDREKANGEIPYAPNTSLRESMVCKGISAEKVNLKTKNNYFNSYLQSRTCG